MGYRTYIGTIPKKEYNKIKSLNREQLIEHYNLVQEDDEDDEDGRYINMGVYDFGKCLFEFGKYNDFDPPKKSTKNFFKNKDLNKYFAEYNDFKIVTKEFLEYIIDYYRQKIVKYYSDMVNPFFEPEKCELLKTAKMDYGYKNDNITFDFTKITQAQQNALFKILEHVRSMSSEWIDRVPYQLNSEHSHIVSSWKYEYGQFELVKIYKTFDWKRNMMYFYGY